MLVVISYFHLFTIDYLDVICSPVHVSYGLHYRHAEQYGDKTSRLPNAQKESLTKKRSRLGRSYDAVAQVTVRANQTIRAMELFGISTPQLMQ